MDDTAPRDEPDPRGETSPTPDVPGRPIKVPSADVLAIVRHDEPPAAAPDSLGAYVVRVAGADTDWLLTDDAVAFGPPAVVQEFTAWRASWERVWQLDPLSTIRRLLALMRASDVGADLQAMIDRHVTRAGDVLAPTSALAPIGSQLADVAELVRRRDAEGYGIVDASPDAERTGLARAWPSWGEVEVLAADRHTEIRFEPASGIAVRTEEATIVPVVEVTADEAGYVVADPQHSVAIPAERGRPLAWLMPGSTHWRVRRVPEVVVWARTFGGLEECYRYATELDLPVRFTTQRPIFTPSVKLPGA